MNPSSNLFGSAPASDGLTVEGPDVRVKSDDGAVRATRRRRPPLTAALALALALALGTGGTGWWLFGRDDPEPASSTTGARIVADDPEPTSNTTGARIVAVEHLPQVEAEIGHPLFWAGPRDGYHLEFTVDADGAGYLRYLPEGVAAGSPDAEFTLVATYSTPEASKQVKQGAARKGAVSEITDAGAMVEAASETAVRAYLAFPDVPLLVEVYDPEPGRAFELATSGAVRIAP